MAIPKIMIVDRDRETTDLIASIQDDLGLVRVEFEPIKNKAIERIHEEKFNAVFFDPAPNIDDLRAFIIGVRRHSDRQYTSVIAMSRQIGKEEASASGTNDFLPKPLEVQAFKDQIKNVKNLHDLIHRLVEDKHDYISKDGVISKRAFYQIFVSALDRADRYAEETYLIFVSIDNIHDLESIYGMNAVEDICDKLKKYTVKIRRVSDIIGRTSMGEFCLMIVRPMNRHEPILAVNRFAESMTEYSDIIRTGYAQAKISVHMMELPSGKIIFSKDCYPNSDQPANY